MKNYLKEYKEKKIKNLLNKRSLKMKIVIRNSQCTIASLSTYMAKVGLVVTIK